MDLAEHMSWLQLSIGMSVNVSSQAFILNSIREEGFWSAEFEAEYPGFGKVDIILLARCTVIFAKEDYVFTSKAFVNLLTVNDCMPCSARLPAIYMTHTHLTS
jgi:hypothetical protein